MLTHAHTPARKHRINTALFRALIVTALATLLKGSLSLVATTPRKGCLVAPRIAQRPSRRHGLRRARPLVRRVVVLMRQAVLLHRQGVR